MTTHFNSIKEIPPADNQLIIAYARNNLGEYLPYIGRVEREFGHENLIFFSGELESLSIFDYWIPAPLPDNGPTVQEKIKELGLVTDCQNKIYLNAICTGVSEHSDHYRILFFDNQNYVVANLAANE